MRFPARVYREGDEPDPRFTLANERTFLAWIRTSIALIAAGVALEALSIPLQPGLRLAAALALIAMGLAAPAVAFASWAVTERALRLGRPLPGFSGGFVLAVGLPLTAVLVTLGLLFR